MASEAEYARLVSLGALRGTIRALVDARDLMIATDNPTAERLTIACRRGGTGRAGTHGAGTAGGRGVSATNYVVAGVDALSAGLLLLRHAEHGRALAALLFVTAAIVVVAA